MVWCGTILPPCIATTLLQENVYQSLAQSISIEHEEDIILTFHPNTGSRKSLLRNRTT